MIKRYMKKPYTVEAVQYIGDNKREIIEFTNEKAQPNTCYSHMSISTLEGTMRADVGDFIIKGIKGEFYPCKPDIFEQLYEEVK